MQTEHATNKQMALVMGWTLTGNVWIDKDGNKTGYVAYDPRWFTINAWHPIADLNHAARVEARLAELGLYVEYVQEIIHTIELISPDLQGVFSGMFRVMTASAQTRCDAAWATWQAWKEQK